MSENTYYSPAGVPLPHGVCDKCKPGMMLPDGIHPSQVACWHFRDPRYQLDAGTRCLRCGHSWAAHCAHTYSPPWREPHHCSSRCDCHDFAEPALAKSAYIVPAKP